MTTILVLFLLTTVLLGTALYYGIEKPGQKLFRSAWNSLLKARKSAGVSGKV